jgi:hypothetical protein
MDGRCGTISAKPTGRVASLQRSKLRINQQMLAIQPIRARCAALLLVLAGCAAPPEQTSAPAAPRTLTPPPNKGTAARTTKGTKMAIDDETKQRIDRWIKDNNRNQYGDPKDTMYAGGTPLFSEMTGASKDRYEYILEKHPELRGK